MKHQFDKDETKRVKSLAFDIWEQLTSRKRMEYAEALNDLMIFFDRAEEAAPAPPDRAEGEGASC